MSNWPATKTRRVFAALERIGWRVKRQSGSHKLLTREGWPESSLFTITPSWAAKSSPGLPGILVCAPKIYSVPGGQDEPGRGIRSTQADRT